MIQFKENEMCDIIKAVTYYRDQVTGSEWHWDKYNDLIIKLYAYGEDASPEKLTCEDTDGQ